MHHHMRPYWFILIPLLISLISHPLWGYPLEKTLSLAILVTSMLMWISESIPAPITALIIPCLGISYGIITPQDAFSPFASEITFLFIGAFFLALGLEKHSLDRRIALSILSLGRGLPSLRVLICLLGSASFFLSMWMSNTATVAIICPIALGVISIINQHITSETDRSNFNAAALLFICYAATFGGIATPIGTPANLLTIGFLAENNLHISFLDWITWGLPISLICFLLLSIFLLIRFKITEPPLETFQDIYKTLDHERLKLGKMSQGEMQVATLFILAITLWICPDLMTAHPSTESIGRWLTKHLPTANVALMVGLGLFLLPTSSPHPRNLIQEEINQIDWGTIFLFGGGLSLSAILVKTGMAHDLGHLLAGAAGGGSLWSLILLSIVALLLSEIISNTASAAILLSIAFSATPILQGFSSSASGLNHAHLISPIMAVGISSSLGFMMPIATPPNTIVYGTGLIPLKKMLTTGLVVNLIGLFVVVTVIYLRGYL